MVGGIEEAHKYKNPHTVAKYHIIGESRTKLKGIGRIWHQLHQEVILGISITLYPTVMIMGVWFNTTTLFVEDYSNYNPTRRKIVNERLMIKGIKRRLGTSSLVPLNWGI